MNKLAAIMLKLQDNPVDYLEKVAIEVPGGPSLIERLFRGPAYDKAMQLKEEALAANERIRKAALKAQTNAEMRSRVFATDPLARANRFVTSPTGRAAGKGALALGGAGTLLGLAHILTRQRSQGGVS
jgi:hypothetical protein